MFEKSAEAVGDLTVRLAKCAAWRIWLCSYSRWITAWVAFSCLYLHSSAVLEQPSALNFRQKSFGLRPVGLAFPEVATLCCWLRAAASPPPFCFGKLFGFVGKTAAFEAVYSIPSISCNALKLAWTSLAMSMKISLARLVPFARSLRILTWTATKIGLFGKCFTNSWRAF